MHIYSLPEVLAALQIKMEIMQQTRYQDPRNLVSFGDKRFSQSDEDGIIGEIFRRIGTTSRRFVEIGVQDGLENNSLSLLLSGWAGTWIEADEQFTAFINAKFQKAVADKRLSVLQRFVNASNAASIASECESGALDLLSIDIDGNDFHVAPSFLNLRPWAVVLEYNARFGAHNDWVIPYNPIHQWNGTVYFGASLAAWKRQLNELDYSLVSCNLLGNNSFFVSRDCLGTDFHNFDDLEFHFEPARYYLLPAFQIGHPLDRRAETSYF